MFGRPARRQRRKAPADPLQERELGLDPAERTSSIVSYINGGLAQPSQSVQYAWAPFWRAIWDRCRTRKQE
jgi:hypothetical protein